MEPPAYGGYGAVHNEKSKAARPCVRRVPITVPVNTPNATEVAMNGLISPRVKYVPALSIAR
jgi:hypothetical protein